MPKRIKKHKHKPINILKAQQGYPDEAICSVCGERIRKGCNENWYLPRREPTRKFGEWK